MHACMHTYIHTYIHTDRQTDSSGVRVGGQGGPIPPLFPTPKIDFDCGGVRDQESGRVRQSDFLSITIVNFSDFLPVRNTKSLTF